MQHEPLKAVSYKQYKDKHTQRLVLLLNPLSLNSDQHQFSPNNIRTISRDQVMRINKLITLEKML